MFTIASISARRVRLAAPGLGLALVLALLSGGAVIADNGTESGRVIAQIESLDRFQAEQERLKKLLEGKPKPYEDKVMDPSGLPALAVDDDSPPDASQMGFRSFMLETRFGVNQASGTGINPLQASEFGLRGEYRQETMNYGDFMAQFDMRSRNNDPADVFGQLSYSTLASSDRITLRNIGLPVTRDIFADSAVGDIYTEVTDALARNYRLSLGSGAVRGVSTRVFGRDFDLRLGTGERGNLLGGPYPGFERSQGSSSWLGYSRRFGDNFYGGVQVNQATNVTVLNYNLVNAPPVNSPQAVSSVAASIGYGRDLLKSGDQRYRLLLLNSNTSGGAMGTTSAQGTYFEGGLQSGLFRHEFGAYSAGPNLQFGDYTVSADNRGVYWRVDHVFNRLAWGTAGEWSQQNPGRDPSRISNDRTSVSANATYRWDRDTAFGGNFTVGQTRYNVAQNLAATDNSATSIYATAFYQTRFYEWGRSRFSASVYNNDPLVANGIAATGDQFQWEHDWIVRNYENLRPEFATTLGLAHDRSGGLEQTYPTAGVRFRYWPDVDWTVSGNLNYSSSTGNLSTSQGLSGTFSTERRLGAGWRFGATASINQVNFTVNATQSPLNITGSALANPLAIRTEDKSLYVYLRWEGSAGSPLQSAGLRNGGSVGNGGISGVVYFDANRDGEQQVGETGVPNVEVFLDGRYRVTTDRDGKFEFPVVATGYHQLTLRLESVPLPWGAAQDRGVIVDVPLRGQITAHIPVVRVGE